VVDSSKAVRRLDIGFLQLAAPPPFGRARSCEFRGRCYVFVTGS
jgi:hypothetical protein